MRQLPAFVALLALLAPAVAHADDAAPPGSPPALVKIDSTRPFTVSERRANQITGWSISVPLALTHTEQWEPVCVAPCDVRLDPNGVYHVGGGGVSPSGIFAIPRGKEPVRLHVHAGSSFWHETGLVTAIFGAVTAVSGLAVAGNGASGASLSDTGRAGLAISGVGGVALIGGLAAWAPTASRVVGDGGRPF